MCHWCDECQKVQTLIRRYVRDAAAGLGLHFLHMSQGPFSRDAGHIVFETIKQMEQRSKATLHHCQATLQ